MNRIFFWVSNYKQFVQTCADKVAVTWQKETGTSRLTLAIALLRILYASHFITCLLRSPTDWVTPIVTMLSFELGFVSICRKMREHEETPTDATGTIPLSYLLIGVAREWATLFLLPMRGLVGVLALVLWVNENIPNSEIVLALADVLKDLGFVLAICLITSPLIPRSKRVSSFAPNPLTPVETSG